MTPIWHVNATEALGRGLLAAGAAAGAGRVTLHRVTSPPHVNPPREMEVVVLTAETGDRRVWTTRVGVSVKLSAATQGIPDGILADAVARAAWERGL